MEKLGGLFVDWFVGSEFDFERFVGVPINNGCLGGTSRDGLSVREQEGANFLPVRDIGETSLILPYRECASFQTFSFFAYNCGKFATKCFDSVRIAGLDKLDAYGFEGDI